MLLAAKNVIEQGLRGANDASHSDGLHLPKVFFLFCEGGLLSTQLIAANANANARSGPVLEVTVLPGQPPKLRKSMTITWGFAECRELCSVSYER